MIPAEIHKNCIVLHIFLFAIKNLINFLSRAAIKIIIILLCNFRRERLFGTIHTVRATVVHILYI